MASLEKGRLALVSRSGRDITAQFPEIALKAQRDCVVDGELVVIREGVTSFPAIQGRVQLARPLDIAIRSRREPATLILFDLLVAGGEAVLNSPLWERRKLLEGLVAWGGRVHLSPAVPDPPALFALARQRGWEGIVAKRVNSPYLPGVRSPHWAKVKLTREGVFLVGGVTRGEGWRADTFGALLLGEMVDGRLVYRGAVGTGFSDSELARLLARLSPLAQGECPFLTRPDDLRSPVLFWTRPQIRVEVSYLEISQDGRLRFPAYRRLR